MGQNDFKKKIIIESFLILIIFSTTNLCVCSRSNFWSHIQSQIQMAILELLNGLTIFLWDFQCEMWSQSGHMYYSHYSVCNIVIKNFSTCSSISKYESYTDDCFWLITSIHLALKMMLTDNFDVSDTARVSQLLWILVWERNINVIKFTLIHKTWRKLFSKQLLLLKFGLRQQKSCWQPAQ